MLEVHNGARNRRQNEHAASIGKAQLNALPKIEEMKQVGGAQEDQGVVLREEKQELAVQLGKISVGAIRQKDPQLASEPIPDHDIDDIFQIHPELRTFQLAND